MGSADLPIRRHTRSRKCRLTIRYRLLLATLFLLLSLPFALYHLIPSFSNATHNMLSKLFPGASERGEFCTREVGNFACCTLYLDAMPCMDDCRRTYVNDVLELGEGYEACEGACLQSYNATCGQRVGRDEVELALRGV